jgi:hypothetical protein
MRAAAHAGLVLTDLLDIDALVDEIRRYLAAVDAFRLAGCTPLWRREPLR